jgi:hypothetical protein
MLLLLAVFLTAIQPSLAQGLVFATNSIPLNEFPMRVVAGDINGDGAPDLICSEVAGLDSATNMFLILTNDGHGAFGSNYGCAFFGSFPTLAVADVNNAGCVDLIGANGVNDTLVVLTNNGIGQLNVRATLAAGASPMVWAADVNRDGAMDLIAADGLTNTLMVWTNDGHGEFTLAATLSVGNGPTAVAAADVNGDGWIDLICANSNDNTVSVLTNNGGGQWGLNATLKVGNDPQSLVVADLNGDGKPDLACANAGGHPITNTVTIFTNDGFGGFGTSTTVFVGMEPVSLAVADLNGDGWPDLVTANKADNTLTVLTNNGRGSFALGATLAAGKHPGFVTTADLNGDGKMDLICANVITKTLTVLINGSVYPSATNPPVLTLHIHGKNGRLDWPAFAPGWSLWETSDLAKTNWQASGYRGWPITECGTNQSLVIPFWSRQTFFRFQHP